VRLTMSLPEKDILNRTRSYFLDQMAVCCGGRIAEKIHTGDISTGASQDIAQATDIARKMVCSYGMTDKFGFQAFSERNQFAAAELPPAFSEKTSQLIDDEVTRLVNEAYTRAESLIRENADKLEKLALALVEKETIDGREIAKMLGIEEEETK